MGSGLTHMTMWKHVARSQVGTSHQESGQPCQDSQSVRVHSTEAGEVLVFVCSDGAGSASHSEIGSQLACERFIDLVIDYLEPTDPAAQTLDRERAKLWAKVIRSDLESRALELSVESRELACTFLAGIVRNEQAVFMQIGDGAIVVRQGEGLVPVFWPQSGEYINTTNFLTDAESEEKLEFTEMTQVDELAIFTDGLERLLLRFDDKSVHQQALVPMLNYLSDAATEQIQQIESELAGFLDSAQVNSRTDDDKTLILATRSPSHASLL